MMRILIGTALLGAVLGCGTGQGDRGAVSGTVTLDGSPIEEGRIVFTPLGDTNGSLTGGTIQGGKYTIPAAEGPMAGRHQVQINSPRKTGKMVMFMGEKVEELVETVPSKYNAESTLTVEIGSGDNVSNFELKSQ